MQPLPAASTAATTGRARRLTDAPTRAGRSAALAAAALLAAPAASRAAAVTGYETLSNWLSLPTAKTGEAAGLASSYDTSGNTFNDHNHYAGTADGRELVGQINGTGVITRFWMPHYSSSQQPTVAVYVDGSTTPVILGTPDTILGGTYGSGPQFRSPLVQTANGGQVSYEPIAFQNSVKIETTDTSSNFYQWDYRLLPAGSTVTPYTATPTAAQQSARAAAASTLNNAGSDPGGADPGGVTVSTPPVPVVPAGGSLTLANVGGSGQIRALNLQLKVGGVAPTDAQLDGLRLAHQLRQQRGQRRRRAGLAILRRRARPGRLPIGAAGRQQRRQLLQLLTHALPQRPTVQLYNSTGLPVTIGSSAVRYDAGSVASGAYYFRAINQQQTTGSSQPYYNVLHVDGPGHYVGNILSVKANNPSDLNVLEGNDVITVDGATTLHGTGLEDAYNGGYYYNQIPAFQQSETAGPTQPLSGVLDFNINTTTAEQYRWMIGDYVPFSQGIDVNMENIDGATWGSTAFFYSAYVPEPGGLALLGLGLGLLGRRRRVRGRGMTR